MREIEEMKMEEMRRDIQILKEEITELKFVCFGLIYDTQKLEEVLDDKRYRTNNEDRSILLSDRSNDSTRNNKINI